VLAALMPSIGILEPSVAWLIQRRGMSRSAAVWLAAGSGWVVGIGSVLSLNRLSGWYPLGFLPIFAHKTCFDVLDYICSNIMLPVGALLTSILLVSRLSAWFATNELAETTWLARGARVSGYCGSSCPSQY
jgi:NSS family neurotransmitter:Na+ symporter